MGKQKDGFVFENPAAAREALVGRLAAVGVERVGLAEAAGRVLGEEVTADRDSPACDVSAMDGYAMRLEEARGGEVEVEGEARVGQKVAVLGAGRAMYIVTGAPVPEGAEVVVRVEDVERAGSSVQVKRGAEARVGMNIRRQGENLRAGAEVLGAGSVLHPAAIGTLAAFGVSRPAVRRKVRVGILTTGDEVLPADAAVAPWQIRNSNWPALGALVSGMAFAEVVGVRHALDVAEAVEGELRELLDRCDAVLMTGGVSMGSYDHVPGAVAACGCETVFHKLPIRPGKPVLGAVGPAGQLVLGLPGNPVSVLATARYFGWPALLRLAGGVERPVGRVRLRRWEGGSIGLWWWRLVRLVVEGEAELVETRGSGDVASAARADGFVEVPPKEAGEGPWRFYGWGG